MKRGEKSGIDWRMETIDFNDGLLLGMLFTERKTRRAMQDERASSGCLKSSRTAFPFEPCELRGHWVICALLLFSHDMEHQSKDP